MRCWTAGYKQEARAFGANLVRMFKCMLGAFVCAFALTGCGSPEASTIAVQEVTTPVLLRVGDQKGDKWSIAVNSMVEARGTGRMKLNMVLSSLCIGRTDEKVRYKITFPSVKASEGEGELGAMGTQIEAIQGLEMEVVSDLRNNVLATYVDGQELPDDGTTDTSRLVFPDKPVKSGDTWEGELKSGEMEGKLLYTFRGKTTHNGVEAYVISGEFPSGQRLQGDLGFEYIMDAKRLQVLQMKGGFREGRAGRGEFNLNGGPN